MATKVAFDIGNTEVKVGIFLGDELTSNFRIPRLSLPAFQSIMSDRNADFAIISSVKKLSKQMQALCKREDHVFHLDLDLKMPIKIKYRSPATLGADRVSAVVGAWTLVPNENSLVIDAGTCITYDLVEASGNYIGGNISPGLRLRLRAMHEFTDQLPQVELSRRFQWVGTDTKTALQVGAQVGALHEMKGFIAFYRKKFKKLNILLTGGDHHFFVNYLKIKIFVRPQLVLIGMNKILDLNV